MKITITAYCSEEQAQAFLRDIFAKAFCHIGEEAESYVREHRFGLPFCVEWDDEHPSVFLTESFELDFSLDFEGRSRLIAPSMMCIGTSWTPYDLWYELEPPDESLFKRR